jgi:hypothetical protein
MTGSMSEQYADVDFLGTTNSNGYLQKIHNVSTTCKRKRGPATPNPFGPQCHCFGGVKEIPIVLTDTSHGAGFLDGKKGEYVHLDVLRQLIQFEGRFLNQTFKTRIVQLGLECRNDDR